ncbi:hypothetical protein V865_002522 [Kwoniella europaea PYCC6329]|uniref:Uncharacterized protein n=1 Tax=Kwoniella europaea PYCC6329 TaxID=1423913 RepID=A0AAX4KEI5_9TREE
MVFSTYDTAAARLRALDARTQGSNVSSEIDSDTEHDTSMLNPQDSQLHVDEEPKGFSVTRSLSWPLPLERVTRGMGNLTMSGVNSTVHYVEEKAKDAKNSVDIRWNRSKMKTRINEYQKYKKEGVILSLDHNDKGSETIEDSSHSDEEWGNITASQIGLIPEKPLTCEQSQIDVQDAKVPKRRLTRDATLNLTRLKVVTVTAVIAAA